MVHNDVVPFTEKGKNTVGTESLKIFLSTLNPTKLQATEMLLVLLKKEIKGDKEQIFVISKSLENGITPDHPDPNQFTLLCICSVKEPGNRDKDRAFLENLDLASHVAF
ncbi:Os11g0674666 [Oryza sativa Japonica Group]|uniref:Os11g0674666 protein n=1 Tax=Oryza sativa subsp. japonica TaxID=39947 RepID=A0A0P0Y5C5_ORYSJ|nr:Os11g0674666 [Oryza sativa Japonica Group]